MDLRGIVSSRDIGISLKGRLGTSGKYDYWVMAGNGSGNNPEIDKFKRAYFMFHWKPTEKFQATFFQDYRALPDIPDPNDAARFIGNSSKTTGWFAGYGVKDKYNIGYEGFTTRQENGVKIGSTPPFISIDQKTHGDIPYGRGGTSIRLLVLLVVTIILNPTQSPCPISEIW